MGAGRFVRFRKVAQGFPETKMTGLDTSNARPQFFKMKNAIPLKSVILFGA